MSEFVVDLSEYKKKIAEDAKEASIQIVQDALDKQFYGFPVSFGYSCGDRVDSHTFCCIPTKEFLEKLLAKINEINFKEDTDPEERDTFAYVIPRDRNNVVYLCALFWEASSTLCEDSQPGTIIHEVSHLLGTIDITYEHRTVEIYEEYGTLLGKSQRCEDLQGKGHYTEEAVQVNANSLEHEFETMINHNQEYSKGRYPCCEETKKNSVCCRRARGHYYLHERFGWQKDDMEKKVAKFMEEITARVTTDKRRIKYVKRKNKACEVIDLSGP